MMIRQFETTKSSACKNIRESLLERYMPNLSIDFDACRFFAAQVKIAINLDIGPAV